MRLPQNHRMLSFLPLVFIIGGEGFAMFAPYVVLMLSLAYLARRLKPVTPTPAPIPVSVRA